MFGKGGLALLAMMVMNHDPVGVYFSKFLDQLVLLITCETMNLFHTSFFLTSIYFNMLFFTVSNPLMSPTRDSRGDSNSQAQPTSLAKS